MLSEEHPHHHHPRAPHQRNEDVSLITSTSPPISTMLDANTTLNTTTATTTACTSANLRQQREAQLRLALQHTTPTQAEVSGVASAAYVQALMALIDQHGSDVQQVCNKIDALQARREGYHAELTKDALRHAEEVQLLRNERSDLTLQVQEERERSTRLLHETTVLHAQQQEQQEQVGRLVELCRARGARLRSFYHHLKHGARGGRAMQIEGSLNAEGEEVSVGDGANGEPASIVGGGGGSPSKRMNATPPSTPPVSLSIHRASCGGVTPPLSSGGAFSLKDIGDDAEVAAIVNVPYKTQLPRTSSSPSAPHVVTVTANTTTTARLLALTEEVHMIQQQLEEQRGTYEQERGLRTREDNTRHRRAQEQLADYAATVRQLEALHEESLRELVLYRHSTDKQLRDVQGQVEWLRVALQDAMALAEKDRRRQHNEVYATEQRMSKQYYPKVQSLHSELAEYRRTTAAQSRDYAVALAKKDERIAELQAKVKAEATQRRRVEERYKLEMDGVHSELDLMRQSLRQMERRVYYRNVRDQASEEAEMEETEGELERYYN